MTGSLHTMVTMASLEGSPSKYLHVSTPSDYEATVSPRTESTSLSSKMKKMLSSPKVIRGKPVVSPHKTFGVPLEYLYERDKQEVPVIVTRICQYLKAHGLRQEGLFRVNGNMKVVDRLKTAFDKCGDADLEEIGDVPACASLLKMFLRELTEAVIPYDLQPLFISVQDQYCKEKEKAMPLIKELIKRMPRLNACLLKYLCDFMTCIAKESDLNKMTFLALAIVFGPNIFRCGDGLEGLKDQAYVNAVLLLILQENKQIFATGDVNKISKPPEKPIPYVEHMQAKFERKESKEKPVQPLPLHRDSDNEVYERSSPESSPEKTTPTNSPSKTGQKRTSKRKSPKNSPRSDSEGKMKSAKKKSPSRKEPTRCGSPTQTHFSSPLSRHLVDNTINSAVKEHLFGPGLVTSSVESDTFEDVPIETSEMAHSVKNPSLKCRTAKAKGSDATSQLKLLQELPDSHSQLTLTDGDLDYMESASMQPLGALTSSRAQPPKDRRKPTTHQGKDAESSKTDLIYETNDFFKKKTAGVLLKDGLSLPSKPKSPHELTENRRFQDALGKHEHLRSNQSKLLVKSNSVPYETTPDKYILNKTNSAECFVPALDLEHILNENEEVMRSSREKYEGIYNQGPMISPHNSAPNSPRDVEKRHEFWKAKRQDTVPMVDMLPQDLRKRIASLKKIVTNFEGNFEEKNGRKPKPSEKGHIQKYIAELGRAKKQLKELMLDYEENPELLLEAVSLSPDLGTAPNLRENQFESEEDASKEKTLQSLLRRLEDKRLAAGRPHEIIAMTNDQLKDEKLAVQKALLQYENVHGRPTSKEDKALMRPLYDRYRKIKRRIATGMIEQSPSKENIVSSLYPHNDGRMVPGQTRDGLFTQPDKDLVGLNTGLLNRIPSANSDVTLNEFNDDGVENDGEAFLRDTFSVTRRFHDAESFDPYSPASSPRSMDESVLHDATIGELLEQQRATRRAKKKLGKVLKDFEEDFFRTTNRKMQKEDRLPKEAEYREYKLIKAKLKLVEALIGKKSGNSTV